MIIVGKANDKLKSAVAPVSDGIVLKECALYAITGKFIFRVNMFK